MLIRLLRLHQSQFLAITVLSAMFSIIYNYLHKRRPPFEQLTYNNLAMMLHGCHNIASGNRLIHSGKTLMKMIH